MARHVTPINSTVLQEKVLRKILRDNAGCSLFARLGIAKLYAYKDFNLLYQSFVRAVPIVSPRGYLDNLTGMAQQGSVRELTQEPYRVLMNPKMVSAKPPAALCWWRQQAIPVSTHEINAFLAEEAAWRTRLTGQGHPIKGAFFYLPEAVPLRHVDDMTLGGFATAVDGMRGFFEKRRALPRLSLMGDSGGSRMRWFAGLLDQLQHHGEKVEVMVAHPTTLIDFGLYASQQAGRFLPLRELCPNLKILLFNGYDVAVERMELGYLLAGLPDLKWAQWIWQPSGLNFVQDDLNLRQRLAVRLGGPVFYEFVPVSDVLPDGKFVRNYRRVHAGMLENGKEYAVIVSNLAGLMGVSTGQVVKVLQVSPLLVQAKGPLMQLNGLNEGIKEEGVVQAVSNINTALQGRGVFVRHALMGHHIAQRQPVWVVELSRPMSELPDSVLDSMAKRLHAEMDLRFDGYRKAIREAKMKLPVVHFVGMGSFAAAQLAWSDMSRLDHTSDAAIVNRILAAAWQVKTIENA